MKRPIKTEYDGEAIPADAMNLQKPLASITVVKVVRECIPMMGGGTSTYGEILDMHLAEAWKVGDEVQSVEFEISPEGWGAYGVGARR